MNSTTKGNMSKGLLFLLLFSLVACSGATRSTMGTVTQQAHSAAHDFAPDVTEDGYDLWLRYRLISDSAVRARYASSVRSLVAPTGQSAVLRVAAGELNKGLSGLLGHGPMAATTPSSGSLVMGSPSSSSFVSSLDIGDELEDLGTDGYVIRSVATDDGGRATVIASMGDQGVLYGSFHFLRLLQTGASITDLNLSESPRIKLRVLNHWDNLDRTVERGYSGASLWDWHRLPDYLPQRYRDYARANASIGINGTVLTNVNANALVLTAPYLEKVEALAGVFREYGIRVYLTARFSAPVEIGGLDTADPLDPAVREWWAAKTREIYRHIPDFGGFLVKANSEGQPGPQDYDRSHADGANMLADAVAPFGGIVMWRAFVYTPHPDLDRAGQAHFEFHPLDGTFRDNVLVQVKNGPIDFQPREPFSALFGAMPQTPLMMEFQITKEYLGLATHLTYLGGLYEEVLQADTYAEGQGSTVARVIDGSLNGHALSGIAGVANIGTDRNWCGSHFACANWYAFGRLAWDHTRGSEEIADEWVRMTLGTSDDLVDPVVAMMTGSRQTAVDYRTPLGLHHIMARSHHYGPGPWVAGGGRPDWTSVYYHKADSAGIGFDRSATGSNTVAQYAPEVAAVFGDKDQVPEDLLLWFHHVPWTTTMASGRTLWDELALRYQRGVDGVRTMQDAWQGLQGSVDAARWQDVNSYLEIQEREARWWRDACLLYFQTFSGMPLPAGVEQPTESLEYFLTLRHRFVPGIRDNG